MKISLFLFLFVYQAYAQNEERCQEQISNYVIRGDLTATYPGARLWRLDQLKKDTAEKKRCSPEIFERAVAESEKYWDHIDSKYHCGSTTLVKNRDQNQCSDSLNDTVLSNKAYLAFIHLEKQLKENCPLQKPDLEVLGKSASRSLRQTAQALQEIVGKNKCDSIPLKDRINEPISKSLTAELSQDLASGLTSCLSGLVSGFFKEGILKSLQSIWSTLKDPWGTLSALQEIAKALIKNPTQTLTSLAQNFVNSFYSSHLARYENFDCYSAAKKSQIMCSSMGQGAAAMVEFFVGGQAFKMASKMIKSTTKAAKSASPLLKTAESPIANVKNPIGPTEPSASKLANALKKQELESKLKQQTANRDFIEERRIQQLTEADSFAEMKQKLQLPDNFTDADVIKHIKKLRSKYHPDKQFVPEDVSTELSKIILKLRTK